MLSEVITQQRRQTARQYRSGRLRYGNRLQSVMKFTPKLPDDSVNVSKTHPLVELFWLLGGLVLACEIVFALLGLAADWAAAKIPINMENWLGDQALSQFPSQA